MKTIPEEPFIEFFYHESENIIMIELKKKQINHIAQLFKGFEDSMVMSCLQGYMGNAYAETLDNPKAALIVSGEYSFFAGDPNSVVCGSAGSGMFKKKNSSLLGRCQSHIKKNGIKSGLRI